MLVTGVQAVGAKGVAAVQGAVVDIKDAARNAAGAAGEPGTKPAPKAGDPQPVVFPRSGLAMDQRPVSLRQHHAALRYKRDGGGAPHHDDAA